MVYRSTKALWDYIARETGEDVGAIKGIFDDIEYIKQQYKKLEIESCGVEYPSNELDSLDIIVTGSDFKKNGDEIDRKLQLADRFHHEVMENIDGQFAKALKKALVKLDEVNEGDERYTSRNSYTYTAEVTDDAGKTISTEVTKKLSLEQMINSETSPIQAAQDIYKMKKEMLEKLVQRAEDNGLEKGKELSSLSGEELMKRFYTTNLGEYAKVEEESFLHLEFLVTAIGTTLLIIGSCGPARLALLSRRVVMGYSAVNAGYTLLFEQDMLTGKKLDGKGKFFEIAGSMLAMGSMGATSVLKSAKGSGKAGKLLVKMDEKYTEKFGDALAILENGLGGAVGVGLGKAGGKGASLATGHLMRNSEQIIKDIQNNEGGISPNSVGLGERTPGSSSVGTVDIEQQATSDSSVNSRDPRYTDQQIKKVTGSVERYFGKVPEDIVIEKFEEWQILIDPILLTP